MVCEVASDMIHFLWGAYQNTLGSLKSAIFGLAITGLCSYLVKVRPLSKL